CRGGGSPHTALDLGERGGAAQIHLQQSDASRGEVAVRVVHPGRDQPAAQIDDARAGSGQRLGAGPESDHAIAAHREGRGHRSRSGEDRSAAQQPHGRGAMAVATRVFDALSPKLGLAVQDRERFRQTLRLAVLFHDLGHAPLSHATERIMPVASDLRVPEWTQSERRRKPGRQADHEDYTLKLVLDSGLRAELQLRGAEPSHVAALICGRPPPEGNPFRSAGRDLLPILRQIVSGELDADRMDYLQRDSFFTGVNYGTFDLDWIVHNLEAVERDGRVHLALQHRAVFAFEDFLLSRYHMFLSVYFHYTSVGYEVLLQRYCDTSGGEYRLPADVDEYLQHDDVALTAALRASQNPWAKRIVRRQGYRLLVEIGPFLEGPEGGAHHLEEQKGRLEEAG